MMVRASRIGVGETRKPRWKVSGTIC